MEACHHGELGRLVRLDSRNATFAQFFFQEHMAEYAEYCRQWTLCELRSRLCTAPMESLIDLASRIVAHPGTYRAFDVAARINLFLLWKTVRDGSFSRDFPADLRHLSNAAYQDIFVTGDQKLLNAARESYPEKDFRKTEEYFNMGRPMGNIETGA